MPDLKTHCEESAKIFGQPFKRVHEWLDAYHNITGYGGVSHRRKRHHQKGLEEVRRMWGDVAYKVAHQHILADLEQVGWTKPLPVDEADCIKQGLWVTR